MSEHTLQGYRTISKLLQVRGIQLADIIPHHHIDKMIRDGPPIAILGAGPSGLILARLLESQGVEYMYTNMICHHQTLNGAVLWTSTPVLARKH